MKKHILILAVAAACLTAGCSKSVKCKCTAIEPNENGKYETTYVESDRGLKCNKITKVGFERRLEGEYVRTLVDVNCERAKD